MVRAKGHIFLAREETTRSITEPLRHPDQAQYPVADSAPNPFKLCDFPLVTPATLLY